MTVELVTSPELDELDTEPRYLQWTPGLRANPLVDILRRLCSSQYLVVRLSNRGAAPSVVTLR
jgi:hypothetical protein